MSAPIEERFWAKVDKSGDCWIWTGGKSTMGYGMFKSGGMMQSAHRVSYELSVGDIPNGLNIDHMCHNRPCVNPVHLRVATQKQNMENRSGANANSVSGERGVFWDSQARKWRAVVSHFGKRHYCGLHLTISDASKAVREKRNQLFTHNNEDRSSQAEMSS